MKRKKGSLCNVILNIFILMLSLAGVVFSLLVITGSFTKDFSDSGKIYLDYTIFSSLFDNFRLSLYFDRLSAIFILLLSTLMLLTAIYSIGYNRHFLNNKPVALLNTLNLLFFLSMFLVFCSGNTILFFFSWELMSLISYFLVMFEHEKKETRNAGTIYMIMTHTGTLLLLAAFIIIYINTGSFDIQQIKTIFASDISAHSDSVVSPVFTPFLKGVLFFLFTLGFGTKAGLVPLHIWLPYAHPAAPSNVSALMSGIMIKTAVYGIFRFLFDVMGIDYSWWGLFLLSLGIASVVMGVLYAYNEKNIKRMLAFSSVENIGIIFMGLGIAAIAYANNNVLLYSLAVVAAILHTINHGLFKALMFFNAGSVIYSTHTGNLEELGGLIKVMPATALVTLAGSLSLSAVVPFNGFISEWLLLQSFFKGMSNMPSDTVTVVFSIIAAAALALAGAMAAGAFVKLFGIGFLGTGRTQKALRANEVPLTMLIPKFAIALLCLFTGIFPLPLIHMIQKALNLNAVNFRGVSSFILPESLSSSLTIQGLFKNNINNTAANIGANILTKASTGKENSINTFLILFIVVVIVMIVFLMVMLAGKIAGRLLKRKINMRTYVTWDCGYDKLDSRMQYSATGFSKPMNIVLKFLYRPVRELKTETGSTPYHHRSMKYHTRNEKLFEKYIYMPVVKRLTGLSKRVKLTFQTGSIHTYIIYIFVAVLLLLLYYRLFFGGF